MKIVLQKVSNAAVRVDEKIIGSIEKGYVVLLGIGTNDTKE
jgi:D-tyrosyl-tRNA(Tyr) deacylase